MVSNRSKGGFTVDGFITVVPFRHPHIRPRRDRRRTLPWLSHGRFLDHDGRGAGGGWLAVWALWPTMGPRPPGRRRCPRRLGRHAPFGAAARFRNARQRRCGREFTMTTTAIAP